MAKAKTAPKPQLTRFQTFTPMRVLRSQMVFVPGNPQTMTEAQAKALSAALDVDGDGVGLLQTIVWNKATGHIVGGNHRVLEIDAHEGYDPITHANDYSIDVAAIDVPEARERAIVLALNNPRLSGQPKIDALRAFLETVPEAERAATGFTADDCAFLLDDSCKVDDGKKLSIGQLIWRQQFIENGGIDATLNEGESLGAIGLSMIDKTETRHTVHDGETYVVDGQHFVVCDSVLNGWSRYGPLLTQIGERALFAPYGGPLVLLSAAAKVRPIVIVQPVAFVASLILDWAEDTLGHGSVVVHE